MKRSLGLVWRASIVGGTLAMILPQACQGATEVTVELETFTPLQCAQLKTVFIAVGKDPTTAEANMRGGFYSAQPVVPDTCDGFTRVGTLVITPDRQAGAIVVAVGLGVQDRCNPLVGYEHCIVARRAFAFIDHVGLVLPISIEAACEDIPCDAQTSCRSGACVDSTASCSQGDGNCASNAEPVLAPDGKPEPPKDDAGNVIPPTPPGPPGTVPPATPPANPPPGGDGGPDAPPDGPPDTGTDTGIDTGTDGNDGSVGGGPTNECPPPAAGGVDCFPASTCCQGASFACTAGAACPGSRFDCTGALHCAGGQHCCNGAAPGDTGTGSTCQSACLGSWMCKTNADCPPTKLCNVPGPTAGGRTLMLCQP